MQKGDILLYINETPVEQLNIDELEWHIFGRKGEMVVLALYRPSNGQTYNIRVNRHIPIQFALGMSVTREPPYSVKRVDELLDPNNENIGDMVEAGDLIESVNGRNCMMEKMRVLEDIIFGPIDSHCTIVFKSLRSASNYKVTFKRHIPVSSWVRWEEQGGMHAAMAPPLKQTPPFMQAPVVPMSQVLLDVSFSSLLCVSSVALLTPGPKFPRPKCQVSFLPFRSLALFLPPLSLYLPLLCLSFFSWFLLCMHLPPCSLALL